MYYIIRSREGYINTDQASGGYSYNVGENWSRAYFWQTAEACQEYCHTMLRVAIRDRWQIQGVDLKVFEIIVPIGTGTGEV